MRTRREAGIPETIEGVLVGDVDPGKPAGRAGIQQGDIIVKVGDTPVLFLIQRGENQLFLAVRIPE